MNGNNKWEHDLPNPCEFLFLKMLSGTSSQCHRILFTTSSDAHDASLTLHVQSTFCHFTFDGYYEHIITIITWMVIMNGYHNNERNCKKYYFAKVEFVIQWIKLLWWQNVCKGKYLCYKITVDILEDFIF